MLPAAFIAVPVKTRKEKMKPSNKRSKSAARTSSHGTTSNLLHRCLPIKHDPPIQERLSPTKARSPRNQPHHRPALKKNWKQAAINPLLRTSPENTPAACFLPGLATTSDDRNTTHDDIDIHCLRTSSPTLHPQIPPAQLPINIEKVVPFIHVLPCL